MFKKINPLFWMKSLTLITLTLTPASSFSGTPASSFSGPTDFANLFGESGFSEKNPYLISELLARFTPEKRQLLSEILKTTDPDDLTDDKNQPQENKLRAAFNTLNRQLPTYRFNNETRRYRANDFARHLPQSLGFNRLIIEGKTDFLEHNYYSDELGERKLALDFDFKKTPYLELSISHIFTLDTLLTLSDPSKNKIHLNIVEPIDHEELGFFCRSDKIFDLTSLSFSLTTGTDATDFLQLFNNKVIERNKDKKFILGGKRTIPDIKLYLQEDQEPETQSYLELKEKLAPYLSVYSYKDILNPHIECSYPPLLHKKNAYVIPFALPFFKDTDDTHQRVNLLNMLGNYQPTTLADITKHAQKLINESMKIHDIKLILHQLAEIRPSWRATIINEVLKKCDELTPPKGIIKLIQNTHIDTYLEGFSEQQQLLFESLRLHFNVNDIQKYKNQTRTVADLLHVIKFFPVPQVASAFSLNLQKHKLNNSHSKLKLRIMAASFSQKDQERLISLLLPFHITPAFINTLLELKPKCCLSVLENLNSLPLETVSDYQEEQLIHCLTYKPLELHKSLTLLMNFILEENSDQRVCNCDNIIRTVEISSADDIAKAIEATKKYEGKNFIHLDRSSLLRLFLMLKMSNEPELTDDIVKTADTLSRKDIDNFDLINLIKTLSRIPPKDYPELISSIKEIAAHINMEFLDIIPYVFCAGNIDLKNFGDNFKTLIKHLPSLFTADALTKQKYLPLIIINYMGLSNEDCAEAAPLLSKFFRFGERGLPDLFHEDQEDNLLLASLFSTNPKLKWVMIKRIIEGTKDHMSYEAYCEHIVCVSKNIIAEYE